MEFTVFSIRLALFNFDRFAQQLNIEMNSLKSQTQLYVTAETKH